MNLYISMGLSLLENETDIKETTWCMGRDLKSITSRDFFRNVNIKKTPLYWLFYEQNIMIFGS